MQMSSVEIVDLSSDDEEHVQVDVKPDISKLKPVRESMLDKNFNVNVVKQYRCKTEFEGRFSEENTQSSNGLSTGKSSMSVLDQGQSPPDDSCISSRIPSEPVCRQFWKAGKYDDALRSSKKSTIQNGKSYLHVHPMFLHSNATSHKWAFGAIAELLDNAVDEIRNGATYVIVDKAINPRDGNPALLIQDDGGGMDPESIRRCMSFGFSNRKSKCAIGKYGNGFKTSSMRLGSDAIVFSRHGENRMLTQSVGLLSYTFLTKTGHERIVVPMVDYEFNASLGTLEKSNRYGSDHFTSNLSILLQWSPYSSEAELLKQFDDIGSHGTKIIIYNLWYDDDGNVELDFSSDPEDIRLCGDIRKVVTLPAFRSLNEQHIANRYHYSLRVYLSILYLRMPENFKITLCGRDVQHHNIASDLKFPEFILYKPQTGSFVQVSVITTIGFLKEAPKVVVHGFNVYHKNRLILPFWQVIGFSTSSRGRGVVGVLEANFIEPTHNKQDFERTSLFQKLENRLKEMTWEYWDYHCGLIGYHVQKKKAPVPPQVSTSSSQHTAAGKPLTMKPSYSAASSSRQASSGRTLKQPAEIGKADNIGRYEQGSHLKRKELSGMPDTGRVKRHSTEVTNGVNILDTRELQLAHTSAENDEAFNLLQEQKKLRAQLSELEKSEEELNKKVTELSSELKEVQREYSQLLEELQTLDVKEEKSSIM